MDELARLEHQGRQERQERKRARHEMRNAPEMREKRLRGRRARRRGRDFERTVAKYLGGQLVPGSGAYGGGGSYYGAARLKGDVIIKVGDIELQAQCKRTKALTTQRKWLDADGSDVLVQADPGERVENALVVMRAKAFIRLLNLSRRQGDGQP